MSDLRLGISDEEFWCDPWRTRREILRAQMARREESFFIDAPERVALDRRHSIPLAIVRASKVGVDSPFRSSAIITAMDLHTGELRATRAFDAPISRAHGGTPVGDAMVGEAQLLDLATRLGIPMVRGEHLVTVLVQDKGSGRRRVRLVESGTYDDPAVEAFIRAHLAARLERPKVSPEPGSDPRSILPNYREMDDSPAAPEGMGITLAIDRVSLLPATECAIFGTYRLPVEPRHVVSAPPVTAILPITLLLTGTVDPSPKLARLHVPCHRALESVEGRMVATGHFTVDLAKLLRIGMTPQTYFVYAFAGATLGGPVPAAFVHIPGRQATSSVGKAP